MLKVKNKFIVAFFASALTISSISVVMPKDINVVYAAESKALRDAKAKINHLTKSIKTNYLGIKNQGAWELYISQVRELIEKIPSSEKAQRDALTIEVNKDEALVNGLARVNQVEKSIAPKDKGGYGNALIIKNAETWNEYLKLAKVDLEKVDKYIFKKQYDELIVRMNKVSLVVKDIEEKFQIEYDKVVKLYEEAKSSGNFNKANEALKEAENLGTCDRSDKLENDIKQLINNYPDNDNKVISFLDENLEEVIRNEIDKPLGSIYKNDVEGITTLTINFKSIESINGIENLINLQELSLDYNKISDITPLKTLTNLKYVALKHNEISDISPLKNFINLQILVLHDNQVSDISPLENLTNLEAIDMYDNQVSDISPLKNLIKLRDIGLYSNRISDLSPLSSLNNLIDVRLAFNEISDISALENLTNLTNLDLRDNRINDISSLKGLVNLNTLWLSGNKINENDIKTLQDYLDCAVL